MKGPRRHSLTFQIGKKKIIEDIWEVYAPVSANRFEFSVVLSCLTSRELLENLSQLLKLQDRDKIDLDNASESFNPFSNKFLDWELLETVSEFEAELEFRSALNIEQKVETTEKLLRCPILIVNFRESCYKFDINSSPCIILFTYNDEREVRLGLKAKDFVEMREKTLKHILRTAEINEEISLEVCSTVKIEDNFLIALLKSENRKIIVHLFKDFIAVTKLGKAGYQIDPRTKDQKGLSALYYALLSGDPELYLTLYHNAANYCGSYIDPNAEIVSNLRRVESILSDDLLLSENELPQDQKDFVQSTLRTLLSVNRFFIEIAEKIMEITNVRISDSHHNRESLLAMQGRDIIVSILNTYLRHFNSLVYAENADASHLEDYVIYKYYYDMVDLTTSFLFFDNIYQLKKNLSLQDKCDYEKIESAFFISVLSYITFDKKLKKLADFKRICSESENSPYKILQSIREGVQNKITLFVDILDKTTIDENNLRKGVPPSEFNISLDSYPEIKDYLMIERLKYYLEYVRNIEEINTKSVLVIQRILQVTGEFMELNPENDFCIQWILSLYMPRNIRKILHKLRDKLSHKTLEKGHYEDKISLFEGIRKEMIGIYEYLKPFFNVVTLRMITYAEKKLEESLRVNNAPEIVNRMFKNNITHMRETITCIQSAYFKDRSLEDLIRVVTFIVKHLNEEIDLIKEPSKKSSQDKPDLKSLITWIKQMIQSLASVLEWIQVIQEENSLLEEAQLLELSESLEKCNCSSSLQDMIDTVESSLSECNTFISEWEVKGKLRDFCDLNIENIEKYLKNLQRYRVLTEEEEDEIRQQILETVKEDEIKRDQILRSIKDNSFFNETKLSELKVSYLSNKNWKLLKSHYFYKKGDQVEKILKPSDPLTELENIFCSKCKNTNDFERFCKLMHLYDKPKILENFKKLLPGTPRKKINKLSALLYHVEKIKKIFIEEDETIHRLWEIDSNEFEEMLLKFRLVSIYINNVDVRFATEISFIQCMNCFDKKTVENLFYKITPLYSGINLRNVIAHGDIMIEKICEFFDRKNLPSCIIGAVNMLIRDEPVIKTILDLYEKEKGDFNKLKALSEDYTMLVNGENPFDELEKMYECFHYCIYLKLLHNETTSNSDN